MPPLAVKGSAYALMKSGKRLQIFRAEPSALPSLKSIRQEIAAREAEQKARAARQVALPEHPAENFEQIILMGATVFENGVSHVTFPDGAGGTIAAVCGFDLSLLSGIPNFQKGKTIFSLYLTHGLHIIDRDGNPAAVGFPSLEVAPGAIVITDGEFHPKILSVLEVLRDLIENEKPRLITFQKNRCIQQAEASVWHAKNPIPPKDETIWLRPHEGSRYLTPEPTKTRNKKGGVK